MPKKFAISLIVLSTILYANVFHLSVVHKTSFFDEMIMQINRFQVGLANKDEMNLSKLILRTILENEHPPEEWNRMILPSPEFNHTKLFYFYKVWSIQRGLTLGDIKSSYPIFKTKKNHLTILKIRYGKDKPILQFPFSKNSEDFPIAGLFLAANELPFSADLNKDDEINHADVVLATKTKEKKFN